ncbi:sulfite exporter TauE/SafE family protein [Defluviimonas sp. WL0050]|uniref:Probable membrane transporter protein n=1 Tax=Albidovulum litorale TaxID=2984134 RepID=A0ABT2ZJ81_9RHOB|nr:sulfite exporter TauE/SafE family protein [Defluviimonas sp. WL0050]MCV2871187.1 sulfite exporter TauE/SafE family protein [Defluviimonas sp. WL0050]
MTLPFDLGAGAGLWLAFAFFAAAFVRGYSGFGFSALVVAAAGLATNPVFLVPVVVIAEIAMTLLQARGVAGKIEWRRVLSMLAGAAVVMPISVALLARVGEDRARIAISLMILVMALILLTGWTLHRKIGLVGHAGVGLASGFANGAAVGGLPVAAFMAAQPIPAAVFRATMVAYLTAIDMVALPLMWANGMVTRDTFVTCALATPLLVTGIWLGGRRFLSATPQSFRRVAILLLIGLSVLGLARSLV